MANPEHIQTVDQTFEAVLEEIRSVQCDVDKMQSPTATAAIWYLQGQIELLRERRDHHVTLRELKDLRSYCGDLEDRLMEAERTTPPVDGETPPPPKPNDGTPTTRW